MNIGRLLLGVLVAYLLATLVSNVTQAQGSASQQQIVTETVVIAALCDHYYPETFESLKYYGLELRSLVTEDLYMFYGMNIVSGWDTLLPSDQYKLCLVYDKHHAEITKKNSF